MSNETLTRETDIQKAITEFYVHCKFHRVDVTDTFINYKIGWGEHGQAFALDEAESIIKKYSLPLKASIIQRIGNSPLLHIEPIK